ncbi:type II CAAX prenyl endopeptidase Rce1 family protein [Qipengyuania sp. DSG2-2]|uniref:CPBP family glutamic-type intramembrane protease n=1 Tax=Qipengyuania sp. DGS2-2 TaxID=3349631 RepID=UPI0036D35B77
MTPSPSTLAAHDDRMAAPVDALSDAGRQPLRAFLRRPVAPDRATGFGMDGLRGVLRLYAVDFAAMSVLGIIALAVVATGFEFPTNTLNEIELTPGFIAIIVLGAPLAEELVFRGWLSGRPGHVAACLLGAVAFYLQPENIFDEAAFESAIVVVMVILLPAAIGALWHWRKRSPMRWFARGFPGIFWLVTLAFALVHLTNYQEGALYVLLPLVLPQFIAGTLFGYARVQYGLWAAILLHAMHNGTAVLLVLMMGEALPAAG